MDIPRIFTISESEHRIHNPFTEEKYATLGRVLRMKPGTRILDLGSGSGEMLCTWARDHGITGTGIDMSSLFTAQAKRRAEELGVSERVHFIHNDAAGYVANEKCDVAACVGATWIAGGFAGAEELAELLGLTPGSVTPFGALNDKEHRVTILLDEDYRGKLIGVHPNDNTATVWLPADALVELLRQQGTTVEFIPF